jgi:hypothetical protein
MRKLRIALFEELSLEEAMDLSQDTLLLDVNNISSYYCSLWLLRTTGLFTHTEVAIIPVPRTVHYLNINLMHSNFEFWLKLVEILRHLAGY